MSARPPTTYLGTRSHFRDGPIKSYRALLSTAIRRKFGGAETSSNNNCQGNSNIRTKTRQSAQKERDATIQSRVIDSKTTGNSEMDLNLPIKSEPVTTSHVAITSLVTHATSLPSPASSTSETSDYQRSTPSPRNETDTSSESGWSSHPKCKQEEPGDEGFSECMPPTRCHNEQLGESSGHPSDNKMFQQLRVALEKMPSARIETLSTKRSKIVEGPCNESSKRIKLDHDESLDSEKRTISLSQHKITDYMTESKMQSAIRKQKLDKILNLKSEPLEMPDSNSSNESSFTAFTYPTILVKTESIPDISLSEISSNDNSMSQNSTVSTKNDDSVFEIPQTIRFPAEKNRSPAEVVTCKWTSCGLEFDSSEKLLDHLKTVHAIINCQKSSDESSPQFRCLWIGCKVFGKASSSKSWLEKHITNHTGNKPFQCIVDGCNMRFSTQSLLARHVNNHFKPPPGTSNGNHGTNGSSSTGSGGCYGSEASFPRFIRKIANGRKVKYRRTIYSARIFDLFDIGVMIQVRQKLSECQNKCEAWRKEGRFETPVPGSSIEDQTIVFKSHTVAQRIRPDGKVEVLQHWTPENLIPDEWTLVKEARPTKKVQLSALPHDARSALVAELFDGVSPRQRRPRKSRPQPRSNSLS